MIYNSILDTVGRTPIVRINRLAPAGVEMYVKVEAFNPGGSVKDRLALAIILDAEAKGTLKPGQTVVEATSGNTGIGLAMVCAAKGYPLIVTMADSFSVELDWFVTGWGTGGTATGAGEIIRLARPDTKIVLTEPATAALVSGQEWKPHKIQGWTPDFVPAVLNKNVAHQILPVDEVLARDTARALAKSEGIFCGISSGGTFAAALEVAKQAKQGDVILAMLPDTGERYLSTFLFEGVNEGSDEA